MSVNCIVSDAVARIKNAIDNQLRLMLWWSNSSHCFDVLGFVKGKGR